MSKIAVSMSVSGGNLTRKHVINVNLDFSNVDNTKVLEWAADNRIIALQRVLRATNLLGKWTASGALITGSGTAMTDQTPNTASQTFFRLLGFR